MSLMQVVKNISLKMMANRISRRWAKPGRWIVVGLLPLMLLTVQPAAAAPYILVDLDSGRILDEKDGLTPWYPASVTKLMTSYVTFEAIENGELTMRSAVIVSQNALNEPPSKMGFRVGTEITVENALKMVLVKSANDIAVALGETVSGSEQKFVARMNKTAQKLGMTGTRFRNPNGLPAKGQTTNARDMAVLTQAILKRFPQHADLFKITAIRAGKKVLRSYNPLLTHYKGATGMKTGFICSSGFNMVATAKRGNKHLIAVVFGSPSSQERAEEAARLLDKGFRAFGLKGRRNVSDFKASGLTTEPVDLRPQICSQSARSERYKRLKTYKMGEGDSRLSKAVLVNMAPVVVRTGNAIKAIAANLRNAPPPVPRPDVVLASIPAPIGANAAGIAQSDSEAASRIIEDDVATGDGDGDDKQSATTPGGIPLPVNRPAFAKATPPDADVLMDERMREDAL